MKNRIHLIKIITWAILIFLLSGCATTTSTQKIRPDLTLRAETSKILLMPMDIQLSLLTAGGMLEPNAEWTMLAEKHVAKSIEKKFTENNIDILQHEKLQTLQTDLEFQKLNTQLIKLHKVVGLSILLHKYNSFQKLPNKEGKFDWSLGPQAQMLKERFGANYALFIYLRDSYCSAGRVAYIAAAAALGYAAPGGQQTGFASLVDLNTGEIVWFNRLIRPAGDLRTQEAADLSVDALLLDFPLK